MIRYVLGFLFNNGEDKVVLIRKNRPEWQKGRLNGVGGKIEGCETPRQAMIREFREETGAEWEDWNHFATLQGETFLVEIFRAFDTETLGKVQSMTDEWVETHDIEDITSGRLWTISNLAFLIPLAINPKDIRLPVVFNYDK